MKLVTSGFTLIELLISIALLGVITVTVLNIDANTQQITSGLVSQNTMQSDIRTAAAIISDEVQRSYYVFPPCGAYTSVSQNLYGCGAAFSATYNTAALNVNFSKFKLGVTGNTTLRPDSTSGASDARTWTVGSTAAPILAMIAAPKDPNAFCDTAATETQGCYFFVAYYPVKRSSVTGTTKETLDPRAGNDNQWVLMEYRRALRPVGGISAFVTTVPGLGGGSVAANLNIPGIYWEDAGCDSGATYVCDSTSNTPPSLDPSLRVQNSDASLPAVSRGASSPVIRALFTAKMDATVTWLSGHIGSANILAENINPGGFSIDYPQVAIDERGVTEVRIKLQAGIVQSGATVVFPKTPFETFVAPRNLPSGYDVNN